VRGRRTTRTFKLSMPTVLVLTFDQALDEVTAEDVKNYVIIDPNGQRDRIRRAVYDAADLTVTLYPPRAN
jgi:hypothetical protein